jgi:Cu2+-exporting ATPase
VTDVTNHLGGGLSGKLDGQNVYIGHKAFVAGHTDVPPPDTGHTPGMEIWLANGHQWLASFRLDDQVRDDAAEAVSALQAAGLQTILLSGDRSGHVQQVADQLGIDRAIGEASPEQKLEVLEELRNQGHQVMMVGDGLNDLPSMAGAGISVAMGTAADLTQLKADAVLLNGQLMQLLEAMKTSRQTRDIIRQNMAWALVYNLLALPLAAAGFVTPWLAAIGMSASSLIVVLNALRLSKMPGRSHSVPAAQTPATAA